MLKQIVGVLVAVAALAAPLAVEAAGPNVGKGCVASWTAVVQRTDTSPVVGENVTYNLYVETGTPALPPAGAAPKLSKLTGTTASPCTALAPGQYTAWVTAVETFPATGGSAESAFSAPFPFVVTAPNPPAGLQVK